MYYSEHKKQYSKLNRRTFFLFLTKLSLFSLAGWRLFDIQISNSKKYETLSKNNQIDLEILFPLRGEIYDRNNNLIATNKKVFDLYIIPEKTDSISYTLTKLSNYIEIDFKNKRKIIELSKKIKKFQKIKVIENVDWETLEKIETNKHKLPGIFILQDYIFFIFNVKTQMFLE